MGFQEQESLGEAVGPERKGVPVNLVGLEGGRWGQSGAQAKASQGRLVYRAVSAAQCPVTLGQGQELEPGPPA